MKNNLIAKLLFLLQPLGITEISYNFAGKKCFLKIIKWN